MVEIILSGGLGNQLFQYAYGKYLASVRKTDLRLNSYRLQLKLKHETPRELEIQQLGLKAKFVNDQRLYGKNWALDKIIKFNLIPGYGGEKHTAQASYLMGHWLNRRFADAIRNDLLEELKLNNVPSEKYLEFLKDLEGKQVLSLHVRRGDYITNPKAQLFHGTLSTEYFKAAVATASTHKKFDSVWVFSDDPAWCRQVFPEYRIIELSGLSPVYEMLLMSKCDSHVISNSTFSWWASWLNQKSNKLIFAPEKWFSSAANPPIYGKEWILLDNNL